MTAALLLALGTGSSANSRITNVAQNGVLETSYIAEELITPNMPDVELIVAKATVVPTEVKSITVELPAEINDFCYEVSDKEIELLALLTMAEAEGESEEGQRLVIDTVLNRVESSTWPSTITDVIYQKNQFSSMWNGRVNRVSATEEMCELVREELRSRTNYDVVYFTANKYGRYGTPLFSVGNHYFSGE